MKSFLLLLQKPFKWAHLSPSVNRVFRILDSVIAGINKNIAVFGLVAGVLIVAINVFTRFLATFFSDIHSLTWGEEVSTYCFIWSALFGAAYGFRKGVHISVMILVERFPPALAKTCVIVSYILSACFLAFMAYAGYLVCELNYELGRYSEALHNVPLWIFLVCLPAAFLGATYRVIEKIYEVSWMEAKDVVKITQEEIIHDSAIKE
ncbi:TRAP transporter small permease [Helicobacter equorum]|uniref:TRAP transporter small permease n=1 Tax=Helicobacter equorum TaxID=361872 RepID=A0A3D8IN31_9HELI|nr:TRAP transporter small permease [Helicobacter equorum]MDD7346338.1 TRAP transporter small permease [Helicobacter sp.]RDU66306.1 TRAP transporter small permease [Helicobacter equorum]